MDRPPLVLLLGAGASFGARAESHLPPPLGAKLGSYLRDWLKANDPKRPLRVARPPYHDEPVSHCPFYAGRNLWSENDLADATARLSHVAAAEQSEPIGSNIPFERLMETLAQHDHSWRLIGTIQRILCYSMLVGWRCAFIAGTDHYDRLLQRVGRARRLVAITLNYDLLLEDALERRGLRFTYPAVRGVAGTIFTSSGEGAVVRVYKPHGSINWLAARSIGVSASLEAARKNTEPLKLTKSGPYFATQSYATYVPPNRTSTFYELEKSYNADRPVVAIYGSGKHLMENPDHVEQHRSDCRKSIAELDEADVLAIGVRPTTRQDDPVLWEILEVLQKLRGLKEYVAPSQAECGVFQKLGFSTREETFERWLAGTLPDQQGV